VDADRQRRQQRRAVVDQRHADRRRLLHRGRKRRDLQFDPVNGQFTRQTTPDSTTTLFGI
jgi:hypothetical protein